MIELLTYLSLIHDKGVGSTVQNDVFKMCLARIGIITHLSDYLRVDYIYLMAALFQLYAVTRTASSKQINLCWMKVSKPSLVDLHEAHFQIVPSPRLKSKVSPFLVHHESDFLKILFTTFSRFLQTRNPYHASHNVSDLWLQRVLWMQKTSNGAMYALSVHGKRADAEKSILNTRQ